MQVSFNEPVGGIIKSVLPGSVVGCNSRYDDPDAEGTTPVRRKTLRRLSASRDRVGRLVDRKSTSEAKTGAVVPPGGALVRRRSAIVSFVCLVQAPKNYIDAERERGRTSVMFAPFAPR